MMTTIDSEPKNFGELHEDVLLCIFRYLGYDDRQAVGATCKNWYNAICYPEMNRNVIATFRVIKDDDTEPVRSFNKSGRSINTFMFKYFVNGHATEFFKKISTMARFIIFKNAEIHEYPFQRMIRDLKYLESLTFNDSIIIYSESYFLDRDNIETQNALANLKMLSVDFVHDVKFVCWILKSIHALESFRLSQYCGVMQFFDPPRTVHNLEDYEFDLNFLVPHLHCLRELDFSGTQICASSLLKLNEIAEGSFNLKCLRLAGCSRLGSNLVAFLKTQPKLIRLNLQRTGIDDDCVRIICDNLLLLEDLNICDNRITNTGAEQLKKLKYLKRLNLNLSGDLDYAIRRVIAVKENLNLRELKLSGLGLSIETIDAVAKFCKQLQVLDLSDNGLHVDDQAVQTIIKNLPKLIELSLRNCQRISDAGLTGINIEKLPLSMKGHEIDPDDVLGVSIENLRNLKKLDLRGCHRITDALWYGLKLKNLHTLDLSNCSKITTKGIRSLVQHAPSIEHLDLTRCVEIDDEAIYYIAKHLKRLKCLLVCGCEKVTKHEFDVLKDYYKTSGGQQILFNDFEDYFIRRRCIGKYFDMFE